MLYMCIVYTIRSISCKNGQHLAVVCKSSGSCEIRDTKKSSEDSQFYRFLSV